MKKYIIKACGIMCFLIASHELQAQKQLISVELGYSFSLDGFSRSFSDGGAFADDGLSFALAYQHQLSDLFRLSGTYFLSRNPVQQDEIDSIIPAVPGLNLRTGHWLAHSVLLGAQIIPFKGEFFEIFAGPLAGFTLASSPSFEGSLGALSLRIDPETGGGLVFGGELGATFWMGAKTGLRIGARFLTARPEPFTLRSPSFSLTGFTIPSQENSIDTRLSVMSVNAAFVYRF